MIPSFYSFPISLTLSIPLFPFFSPPKCAPGYAGSVTAISVPPFYISTCEPVPCPANSSAGTLVVNGCGCPAGYSGTFDPSSKAPYYADNCKSVPCPAHSTGQGVGSGCNCSYGGDVAPSIYPPYYISNCTAVPPNFCIAGSCPATLALSSLASAPYPQAPAFSNTISYTSSGTLVLGNNANGYYVSATAIGGGGAGGSIYYASMSSYGGRGQAGQVVSTAVAYWFAAGVSISFTVGASVSNPAGTAGNTIRAGNPTSVPALGGLSAPGGAGGTSGQTTSSYTGGGGYSWRPSYTTYSGGGGAGADCCYPNYVAGTGGTLNGGYGVDGGQGQSRTGGAGGIGCGGGGTTYQANIATTPGAGGSGEVEFYIFNV